MITFYPVSGGVLAYGAVVVPDVAECIERLAIPKLGTWSEAPDNLRLIIPMPPSARYPEDVRVNTWYWPTHAGGFSFIWVLMGESELKRSSTYVPDNFGMKFRVNVHDMSGIDGSSAAIISNEMYLLRYQALFVAEVGGEKLWLVPFVDDRYFKNRTAWPESDNTWFESNTFLGHAYDVVGTGPPLGDRTDLPNGHQLPINASTWSMLSGPQGAVAEAVIWTLTGQKVMYDPNWLIGPRRQFAEQALDLLESGLPSLLAKLSDGGEARRWATADIPTGVNIEMSPATSASGTPGYPINLLINTAGFLWDGAPVTIWPHLKRLRPSGFDIPHPEWSETFAQMRIVAGQMMAWLTRPFRMVLGGITLSIGSAFVGMYEWRSQEQETVIHGLDADTAWWGESAAQRPATYIHTGVVRATGEVGLDPGSGYFVESQVLGSGLKLVEELWAKSNLQDIVGQSGEMPQQLPDQVWPGAVMADLGYYCNGKWGITGGIGTFTDPLTGFTFQGRPSFTGGICTGAIYDQPVLTMPISVSSGGTGQSTLHTNRLLYGNGTGPIQSADNARIQAGVLQLIAEPTPPWHSGPVWFNFGLGYY